MKCTSCEKEINPQWSHAIDINICPWCGKNIMEEHLKNLFSTLKDTMLSLFKYPDQLNDWMLSNYNFIQTNDVNLVKFVPEAFIEEIKESAIKNYKDSRSDRKSEPKVITSETGDEVIVEKIQDEDITNEFFKRAEAVKPNIDGFKSTTEKTQRLKELAQQIKREGATVINQAGKADIIPPEMIENIDPEAVSEYYSIMEGNEIMSSLPSTSDDEIPSVVLSMANRAKTNGKNNNMDLAKLQEHQSKLAQSRKNFLTGAKGSFSRT